MANPRITQVERETLVEPVGTYAEVAQFYLDVAIMPDSDVTITTEAVSVLRSLSNTILIERTLSLRGQVVASTDDTTGVIGAWLRKRKKKMIFYATLTLRYYDTSAPPVLVNVYLYLANHALNTRAGDSPANTEFIAVLGDENIPPLTQEIPDALYGVTIPSFGKIVINNADGQFDIYVQEDLYAWEGGDFTLKLIGDKSEIDFSYSLTVFSGVMGKVSYSDNNITVEILSKMQQLASKTMPTDTFTGPNGEDIYSPVCYGYVYNLTPILKDAVEYTYKIAGHAISAISAVYDNGVQLDIDQYSTDLTNAEFTLVAVPAGTITCDVQGKKVGGVFTAVRGDFIYDAVTEYGELLSTQVDTAALSIFNTAVPGDSGIYISTPIAITEFINLLLRPVLGIAFFSRANLLTVSRFTLANDQIDGTVVDLSSAVIFPQSDPTSDSSGAGDVLVVDQTQTLYKSVTMKYNKNWTVQKESEIGSADPIDPDTESGATRRAYLAKDGLIIKSRGNTATAASAVRYPTSTDSEIIDSYFINLTDAADAAEYVLDIFYRPRWIIHVKTSIVASQALLNTTLVLNYLIRSNQHGETQTRFFTNRKMRVIGYEENYGDGSVNLKLII